MFDYRRGSLSIHRSAGGILVTFHAPRSYWSLRGDERRLVRKIIFKVFAVLKRRIFPSLSYTYVYHTYLPRPYGFSPRTPIPTATTTPRTLRAAIRARHQLPLHHGKSQRKCGRHRARQSYGSIASVRQAKQQVVSGQCRDSEM